MNHYIQLAYPLVMEAFKGFLLIYGLRLLGHPELRRVK